MGRLQEIMAKRSKFFPNEIAPEDMAEFRAGWEGQYPSTHTRSRVLTRLCAFLLYGFDRRWIDRIPKIASIKVEEPPTVPFTEEEYEKILATIPQEFPADKAKKVRALVQLIRHSGLAIRDAVVVERTEIVRDTKKKLYRVLSSAPRRIPTYLYRSLTR